jgi:hypothetical protein
MPQVINEPLAHYDLLARMPGGSDDELSCEFRIGSSPSAPDILGGDRFQRDVDPLEVRFALDSPLEEGGFEPLVPLATEMLIE